jgi:hypothetical protein
MKSTQAWGWLAAGVLAAGLNAVYHDGGMEWAHRIADRAEHVSGAVVALASGHADRFLAEARELSVRNDDETSAFSDVMDARADQVMARAQARTDGTFARAQAAYDRAQARQEAHCARMEAERARMEARIEAQRAFVRIPDVRVETASIQIPGVAAIGIPRIELSQMKGHCSRIRMTLPGLPNISVPAVNVSFSGGSAEQ